MDRDLFISHATGDAASAVTVCRALEAGGLTCWMAPRDIIPGTDYSIALAQAIPNCRALLLLLSRKANESQWVHREVERAISRGKPILTLRLEDVTPGEKLELFVSTSQWFDAFGLKPAGCLSDLCQKVRLLLPERPAVAAAPWQPPARVAPNPAPVRPPDRNDAARSRPAAPSAKPQLPPGVPPRQPWRSGVWLAIGGGMAMLLAAVFGLPLIINQGKTAPVEPSHPAVDAQPASARAQFEELRACFEDSIQGTCSVDNNPAYTRLQTFVKDAPEAERPWMQSELEQLASDCDAIANKTYHGDEVKSELNRKRMLPEAAVHRCAKTAYD